LKKIVENGAFCSMELTSRASFPSVRALFSAGVP
jgi:hypothetical protein